MSAWIAGLSFFGYQTMLLIGACDVVGHIIIRLFLPEFRGNHGYRMVLGFGILPILAAWLGLTGWITLIHVVSIFTGILAALWGAWIVRRGMLYTWRYRRSLWGTLCIPIFTSIAIASAKLGYLVGGPRSHHDEERSILFISALANNFLKPAYPFNYSIPVAYPFYLFETGSLLYLATNGWSLPSIPLLVITLGAIAMSYAVLWLICSDEESSKAWFIWSSAFITFVGLLWIPKFWDGAAFVSQQVQSLPSTLHAGTHYLFGTMIGILGLKHLQRYIQGNGNQTDGKVFVICMALAFTFAGIPSIWALAAGLLLVCIGLPHLLRAPMINHLRVSMCALASIVCIIGPQTPNLFPRLASTFYFSAPHWWFIRPTLDVINTTIFPEAFWKPLASILILLINVGPILTPVIILAPLFAWLTYRGIIKPEITTYVVGIFASWLLLTFTSAPSGDWFGRGPLFAEICAALIAGNIVQHYKHHKWIVYLCVFFMALQAATSPGFLSWNLTEASSQVRILNGSLPIGSVVVTETYDDPLAEQILKAGRGVFTIPPTAFMAYLNNVHLLEKWGILLRYHHCESSWLGSPTPLGVFWTNNEMGVLEKKRCGSIL